MLEGFPQKLPLQGCHAVWRCAVDQQVAEHTFKGWGIDRLLGERGNECRQGRRDIREIAVEVFTVDQVETASNVAEYALAETHGIGVRANDNFTQNPLLALEHLKAVEQVLDYQQSRMFICMQASLDIGAAWIVATGKSVIQEVMMGARSGAWEADALSSYGHDGCWS